MVEPVRLVIWDLDGTLWRGTLTEGGIEEHVESHYDVVRQLARRGIVSSICSKNDFDAIREILTKQNVWDFFIFPSIDWSPKAPRIAEIVELSQLRPETILFIDDHHGNRAEASALVPGIRVWDEKCINELLDNPLFKGKDDSSLSRLSQYKLLEWKEREKKAHVLDVNEFLRSSNIVVEIDYDIEKNIDRAVELINRTNQLNFTKRRLPDDPNEARQELRRQISANYDQRAGVVKVRDRFGDYGTVGFWMMGGVWGNSYLAHYAFSCRTIGMGIEQWVYHRLGAPKIRIVGEVVAALDFDPDWINGGARADAERTEGKSIPSVRLRGGCELEVMKHFFSLNTTRLTSELVHSRGAQTIWTSHIATLFLSQAIWTERGREALAKVFLTPDDYETTLLDRCEQETLLIVSHSFDNMDVLYRHNECGFVLPFFFFGVNRLVDLSGHDLEDFFERMKYDDSQKIQFAAICKELSENYEKVTKPLCYIEELYGILGANIPANALVVLLTTPTFAPRPNGVVALEDQIETNMRIRRALDGVRNLRIIDMEKHAYSAEKMHGYSHLHFKREVYHEIYEDIMSVYAEWSSDHGKI